MEQPIRDQRRSRRVPLPVLLNKYIEGEPHTCRAVNISLGGMLLYRLFEPAVPHSEVSVEFQLPGSPRILRADGVALNDDGGRGAHAVRFTSIALEDQELIARYLDGELLDQLAQS
jgi:hypothetical protein